MTDLWHKLSNPNVLYPAGFTVAIGKDNANTSSYGEANSTWTLRLQNLCIHYENTLKNQPLVGQVF